MGFLLDFISGLSRLVFRETTKPLPEPNVKVNIGVSAIIVEQALLRIWVAAGALLRSLMPPKGRSMGICLCTHRTAAGWKWYVRCARRTH